MSRLEEFELLYKQLLLKSYKTDLEFEEMIRLRDLYANELKKELTEMYQDFRNNGIVYTNVWDMVNTNNSYAEAIPILLKYLHKNIHPTNLDGIIRALAVKEAKGIANKELLFEYYNLSQNQAYAAARSSIGVAFMVIIREEDVDEILKIVSDKSNGKSRVPFIYALRKLKTRRNEIEKVLLDLLDDDDAAVVISAIISLVKLKSNNGIESLSKLTNHPDKEVRKEANKAIKKLKLL